MVIRKIGIALAAYQPNPTDFRAQLESIRDQTWKEWICCITSDSSLEAIRSNSDFSEFFSDPRFHWRENTKQLGVVKNFEAAIQQVLAQEVDAIACCDQDDIWFPEKLQESAKELSELGSLGLVFCDMRLMNTHGELAEGTAWEVERRGVQNLGSFAFLIRNVVPGTGMLMDAELARRYPNIHLHHDHWYPLVASKIGHIRPIHRPLYAYRLHDNNVTGLTPFKGIFSHQLTLAAGTGKTQDQPGVLGALEKCRRVWRRSKSFAEAAELEGLPLSALERQAFLARWDLGLLLILNGLMRLPGDPALARASWARAVGKLLDSLGFHQISE